MCFENLLFDIKTGWLNTVMLIISLDPNTRFIFMVYSFIGIGSYVLYQTPTLYNRVLDAGIYLTWQYFRIAARIHRTMTRVYELFTNKNITQNQILGIDIVSKTNTNIIRTSGLNEFVSMVETRMILDGSFIKNHSVVVRTKDRDIIFDRCTDVTEESIRQ